jgi:hypothetical protein
MHSLTKISEEFFLKVPGGAFLSQIKERIYLQTSQHKHHPKSRRMKHSVKERKKNELIHVLQKEITGLKNQHCKSTKNPKLETTLNKLLSIIAEINGLHQRSASTLNEFFETYQRLQQLLLDLFASGSISTGTGDQSAKLQMVQLNKKELDAFFEHLLIQVVKELIEEPPPHSNQYDSIGLVLSNIIAGIFSFFISDLEEEDELDLKERLRKSLEPHIQQLAKIYASFCAMQNNLTAAVTKYNNEIITLLQQHAALMTLIQQPEKHFFPNPLMLKPTPGGSSGNKSDET